MAKLICRLEKHGNNSIQNVQMYHERDPAQEPPAHPEQTHLNYAVVPLSSPTLEGCILSRFAERDCQDQSLRKDAIVLCDVFVSTSDEYIEHLSERDAQRFFDTASAFLTARYGEANCMYALVHLDEETPHLHFGFVPITKDGRLSVRQVLGGKEMTDLHTELSAYLRECGFDIAQIPENESAAASTATPPVKVGTNPDAAVINDMQKEMKRLNRDNQRLQLENILLQRQLNNLLGMIDNEPQLEALLLQEIEKQTVQKREWLKQCNPKLHY